MMTTGRDGSNEREDRSTSSIKTAATDDNPLGLPELSVPPVRQPWRWLGLFTFVLIAMSMLATILVVTIAQDKKASLLLAEKNRLQESVSGRAEVLRTWLDGQRSLGQRLVNSPVFRLFVTDLSAHDLRLPLPRSLQDQRPYFHQLMADFANQSSLVRATVLRRDGAILLSSPGPKLDVAGLLERVDELTTGRRVLYSPLRVIGDQQPQLVIEAMMAIPGAQEQDAATSGAQAYLVLTLDARPIVDTVLAQKPTDPLDQDLAIVQRRGEVIDRVEMTTTGAKIVTDVASTPIEPGEGVAFGRRGDTRAVYSTAEAIEETSWSLYQALDAKAVLGPLYTFVGVAITISAMAVLLLTAAFSSLWWRHDRNFHVQLLDLYKDYAEKVDQQRHFLKTVMRSIGDWLVVTTSQGRIIYANPSFNAVAGRRESSANGKEWHEIVDMLPRRAPADDDVDGLIDGNDFDDIEIGQKDYIVSINASDFWDDDGGLQGTVRIIRDHSDLIRERRRRLGSLSQTVNAFIRAVERRDPFLLGHTKRVRAHAIAVGAQLTLSRDDLATLALAASLSQVGKIFIPEEILRKPDRHDMAEETIMRDHILHAIDILQPIDFGLPVAETLAQMYERLDGSGYPHGLAEEDIGIKARILGVADVYCARTAPRSYREQLSAGKALFHLASNEQRYDLKVVSALADVVGNNQELDEVAPNDTTFIDSAIWRNHREGPSIQEAV